MKHNKRETAILIGWTLVSAVFGLFFYQFVEADSASAFEQVGLLFAITAAILIGAIFWYLIIKLKNKSVMMGTYAFGFTFLYASMVESLYSNLQDLERLFVLGAIIVFGFAYYYDFLARAANAKWHEVQRYVQFNNAFTVIALAYIGVAIGKQLNPYIAFLLFVVVAIYDALAVWKLKTMQTMALGFLKNRIVPGIAVAKKQKEKFAILGGGDIFFMLLVPSSFMTVNFMFGLGALVMLFLSILLLFIVAEKKKFYPALPFMLAGLIMYLIPWGVFLLYGGGGACCGLM